MKILILSPHADDAAFSCGDHIIQWRKQLINITVCTVFSKFWTTKISKDVRWYLNNSGFSDVRSFEKARNKEDESALKYLNVDYLSPNLTDGAFRTKNKQLIYQTFDELFSGKIADNDNITINKISYFLLSIKKNFDFIIAPLGIGNHADHLITSLCARKNVSTHKLGFYIDVPYYFKINNWNHLYLNTFFAHRKSTRWTTKQKISSLDYYPSQKPLIIRNNRKFFFSEKMVFFPEIILLPEVISNKIKTI